MTPRSCLDEDSELKLLTSRCETTFVQSLPHSVRDPARMYVGGHILFLAPWSLYVRVHATCAPLLQHVCASTMTHARRYIDQYVRTRSRPE